MIFSSIFFLFGFLTLLLLVYFLLPKKYRNIILLLFSIFFYTFGDPKNVIYLLLSCIANYFLGKLIYESKTAKRKTLLLCIGLFYNLGQLFYFKYFTFFLETLSFLGEDVSIISVVLPIGISFYTFQAISYIVDIYRGIHKPAKNIIEFSTYLTLFPQLIAGPIVRYQNVEKDLQEKNVTVSQFSKGIQRFIIGLSKKVLLANALGKYIAYLSTQTILSSWMKALAYSLQIYFDFSGYSDMAIGLGLMLGFHFLENFNYPFIAKSITDFWRRWHISLSSWFRDYVYIPLGGNRVSKLKWLRNLFIVWFLTGLWHGASWNFILWGLFFGFLLILEKLFFSHFLEKHPIFGHLYTILFVLISFVIFQNDSLLQLGAELKNMFFLSNVPFIDTITSFYTLDYMVVLAVAIVASLPIGKMLQEKLQQYAIWECGRFVLLFALFFLCISSLINSSFNPFLYFRF